MGALDGLVAVSQALHATFGRAVTLRRVTPGAFDAETQTVTETTADETVRGVFGTFMEDELIGDIRASDIKATIYTATEPSTKDRIIDGALEHSIVWIGKQYATDRVAYYTLALRR